MATAKIKLYNSKKLKNGTHPVVLLITHNYDRKKYNFGFGCKPGEWNEELGLFNSDHKGFKKKNKTLQKALFRAEAIIEKFQDEGRDFTLAEFDEQYSGLKALDVFTFFQEVIQQLDEINKIGNADVYRDAYRALANFHKSNRLAFREIDYTFLSKYEHYLRKKGVTDNSISVYMRTLRALFNKAIKQKVCKQEYYPFKVYKISHLDTETMPRAVTKDAIKKIEAFEANPNSKQELSKHLFLFSYYTRGMNFSDIAKLKWSSISYNRITYARSKTAKPLSIKILKPVQEILDLYRQINAGNEYIFPILDKQYDTSKKIKNRIKSALKLMNRHLKIISMEMELDVPLTSYVARHSYATNLKREGISTSIISESLGHSDERTTRIYLDRFENELLDEADEKLL